MRAQILVAILRHGLYYHAESGDYEGGTHSIKRGKSLFAIKNASVSIAMFVAAALFTGCASLPPKVERAATFAVDDTSGTTLARAVDPIVVEHPGLSGFHALKEGIEAYAARLLLVRNAEKTLDIQYYIWKDDLTGETLLNQVLAAADRGVRVRLLLDDLDTADEEDLLHVLDAHPNIEIRLFNPFANRGYRVLDFVSDSGRVNRRMHNKSMTADNQATIFGGRNIGDEYFDAPEAVGFSDMDVLAVGPVVAEVSQEFDLYWNSEWVYPLSSFAAGTPAAAAAIETYRQESGAFVEEARSTPYAISLRNLDIAKLKSIAALDYSWGKWVLAYDQPGKVEAEVVKGDTHLAPSLRKAIDNARTDLIVVSPYFVPGPELTHYLCDLVQRGVRVRVLTNSLAASDVALVHAGYMRYREDLIRGGVELYEFKPIKSVSDHEHTTKTKWSGSSRASLHGKYLGVDQRYLFVGSFNLDMRSKELNTEMGVYFESPRYALMLADAFDRKAMEVAYRVTLTDDGQLQWVTVENGETVTMDVEPETGFWTRIGTRILSGIVPEKHL
jgi:cardiolipin synthase C